MRQADVADLEARAAAGQERGDVRDRPQRLVGHRERDHGRRMAVHHGVDVGPRAKRLAVDVALQEHAPALLIDRVGVEVELHDVLGRHQRRRAGARQQIALRVFRMPHGHMAPGVEHAVLGEDAACGDEVLDQRGIDGAGGGEWKRAWVPSVFVHLVRQADINEWLNDIHNSKFGSQAIPKSVTKKCCQGGRSMTLHKVADRACCWRYCPLHAAGADRHHGRRIRSA